MGSEGRKPDREPTRERRLSSGVRPPKRESITVSFQARDYLDAQDPDPAMELGAANAIRRCLGLGSGDSLLLIVQHDHLQAGASLLRAAEDAGVEVAPYVVSSRQTEHEAFVARLLTRVAEMEASCLVGDRANLPAAFRQRVIRAGARGRHAHMVGLTAEMMSQSMRADFGEVDALGNRLAAALAGVNELSVETAVGTSLTVRPMEGRGWHNQSGLLKGPGWAELPGGEVHTAPASVDGVLIPDGGVWLPDGSELAKTVRLRLHFAGGRLERVEAPAGFDADAILNAAGGGGPRVSRVSFGTNRGVLTSIGELLQDRKMPGFHLTLGEDDGQDTVSGVTLLMRRADVRAHGRTLLLRGRYGNDLG